MASSADALKIVQSLARRTRNARIAYNALIAYSEKYLAKAADEDASLEVFADNPANLMGAFLVELEEAGKVSLTYTEGAISSVYYPDYYRGIIHEAYEKLDNQPDRPFPTEDALTVPIPADLITPLDIKTDFVRWIGRTDGGVDDAADAGMDRPSEGTAGDGTVTLLRIMYPDGIHSMVVSDDLLGRTLPKLSVHKIRQYLRSEKNAGYIRSKLASIFRQREMAMKDMLSSILTTPDHALRTIFNPTDFTFHFWTQLSSTIIKEFSQKKDKLTEEHGFCQAAYMLGYYNVYYRGVLQRTRDTETALRQLESQLRRSPFTYTISEIHGFKDSRGVPLTKKCTLEDVNSYVTRRLKPAENHDLAEMVRIKTPEGKEYYLYRDFVLRVTLDHVFEARRELRDHFVDTWSESLKANKRLPEMTDDTRFAAVLAACVSDAQPMLTALLDFNLLYLARRETSVPAEIRDEIDHLFKPREAALRPLPEILNLDRKKLYSDARLLLPFWQAVPILSAILTFLKRFFLGTPEEERLARKEKRRARPVASTTMRYAPASGPGRAMSAAPVALADAAASASAGPPPPAAEGASRKAQVARFKETVRQLQSTYVARGSTAQRTLDELIERWNPLLDPVAKQNLVEDVNSLARDFLRRMKVTFRLIPPDRHRIQEWAERLAQNDSFTQIRGRDDLKEYLQLYMLTVLGK